MSKFQIRVNGGEERTINVKTTIYRDAALAVPALTKTPLPVDIEIWCADLILTYGPYKYRIEQDYTLGGVVMFQCAS